MVRQRRRAVGRALGTGYIDVPGSEYAGIVEALYSGAGQCVVEAQVRFEDGRVGSVRADCAVKPAGFWPDRTAPRPEIQRSTDDNPESQRVFGADQRCGAVFFVG